MECPTCVAVRTYSYCSRDFVRQLVNGFEEKPGAHLFHKNGYHNLYAVNMFYKPKPKMMKSKKVKVIKRNVLKQIKGGSPEGGRTVGAGQITEIVE